MAETKWLALLFAILALHLGTNGRASQQEAARASSDPTSLKRKLETRSEYLHVHRGGWALRQLNHVEFSFEGAYLPCVENAKTYSIFRVSTPVVYRHTPATTAAGLSDMTALDLALRPVSFGSVGFGPGFSLPTATDKTFGTGKLSIGPALAVTMNLLTRFKFGLVAEQFVSVAGAANRPDQSYLILQPIATLFVGRSYFLNFNPLLRFDWPKHSTIIPVNLSLGKALSKELTAYIQPEYVIHGPTKDDWSIKVDIKYLGW